MSSSFATAVAVAITSLAAVAGCSSNVDRPPVPVGERIQGRAAERELFTTRCGGCHTLSDAGTSGSAGPSLNDADLDADRAAQKVERGGGGMPSGLLEGDDLDAVASYVAEASTAAR